MAKLSSDLRLPVPPTILPFVQAHVRGLAALSKLPSERVEALLSSVAEACTNIIKHAFNPEQDDTLKYEKGRVGRRTRNPELATFRSRRSKP